MLAGRQPGEAGDLVGGRESRGRVTSLWPRYGWARSASRYVYPYSHVDTPGCTVQACGVRDHRADYAKVGSTVLGISPDPVAKVKKFHEKFDLNFPLLADEDHAITERYGVWAQKSMYGKSYMGAERTTFIIDSAGKVAEVLRKVRPAEHDELVLAALQEVSPPVA